MDYDDPNWCFSQRQSHLHLSHFNGTDFEDFNAGFNFSLQTFTGALTTKYASYNLSLRTLKHFVKNTLSTVYANMLYKRTQKYFDGKRSLKCARFLRYNKANVLSNQVQLTWQILK